ncbi:MAG: insulinase family protein [Proteobacteria bacterium]|nr:insulinase family protein [Pseudomonadota bacterium]MCP4919888.1 insulinase family protein [Pseudomonadota bacterium]
MPLIALIMPIGTASASPLPTEIQVTTLDNGLTIYLAPMDTPGVVSYQSWVGAGSRDEVDPGTTGFAHFFEHLMFYGTEALPRAEREEALLRTGANENAWTWFDDTCYHQVVAAEALLGIIEIEADRFQNLDVQPEDVSSEIGAVLSEYGKGLESPWMRTSQALYATAFADHTYHHDTIGYIEDLEAMGSRIDLVHSFFDVHYRPENVRIVVAGDFETGATLAAIEGAYGGWQRGTTEPTPIPEELVQEETRRVDVAWDQGPVNTHLFLGWKVPGFDPADPDAAALAVLGELLFSDVSPLHRDLVLDGQKVFWIDGGSSQLIDTHLFEVNAELREGTNPAEVEARLLAEVASLRTLDEARVASARSFALRSTAMELDTAAAVANTIGWFTHRNADPASIDAYYENFAKVRPADIARVIDAYLVPQGLTVATLTPEPAVEEAE